LTGLSENESKAEMEGLTKFLNDQTNKFPDAAGLRMGFSLAYVSLLQSIAKNDMV